MKPSGVLTAIVAVPVLALFLGVGILAWRIGETWSEAQTSALVTSFSMICGGGALLVAILIAFVVGIPLASRFFHEAGVSNRTWEAPPRVLPPPQPGYQEPRPPQLVDQQGGTWQSSGPAGYDLDWDDEVPVGRQWDETDGIGRRV